MLRHAVLVIAIFVGLSSCLGLGLPNHPAPELDQSIPPSSLTLYILDVGQGDATLVIGPDGTSGLIDSGPPFSGMVRILPVLRQLGIDTLDWVIISHYDADHIGGLLGLLKGEDQRWDTADDILIRNAVWDRGGEKFNSTAWYEEYASVLAKRKLRRTITIGQNFALGNGATVAVVLSNGHYQDGSSHHLNLNEENEASIALLIDYGSFRYLTAGDLTGGGFSGNLDTKDLESRLADMIGPVSVVHLNHHGSRTSSNEHYLDGLLPEAAVISVGWDNDFGHPHWDVLQRLEARGIPDYRSDQGHLEISSDGDGFEIHEAVDLD